MSVMVPSRPTEIPSLPFAVCCLSSLKPSLCRVLAGLVRQSPGATDFAVTSAGPSLVRPTRACFAEQYAWISVSNLQSPAALGPLQHRCRHHRRADIHRKYGIPAGHVDLFNRIVAVPKHAAGIEDQNVEICDL